MIFSEISYKNKQIKSEETFNQLTTKHEKYINSLSRFLSSIALGQMNLEYIYTVA